MTKTDDMWIYYDLTLTVYKLSGGIPKHPEIVKRWQEANWPANDSRLQPGDPRTPEEAAEETVFDLGSQVIDPDEKIAGIWTGFAEKDGQLALENRQIKAMLKESANIVKALPSLKKRNTRGEDKETPLRARLAERVFIEPKWILLGVTEASASPERPIAVMTARGPRTALKRVDVIYDCKVTCALKVLNDGFIPEDVLRVILDHASENGLGTDRSTGSGTFTYELRRRDS